MNDTANPIPVQGNVTVTNTLTGNVNVTNTSSNPVPTSVVGNVGLSPGTVVGIDPTQNLIRINSPKIQPFQRSGSLSYPVSQKAAQWTVNVPAG